MSIYDYTLKDREGNDVPMSNYKGKVILIFSASGTQSYQGYAIMTSCTADSPSNLWQIEKRRSRICSFVCFFL